MSLRKLSVVALLAAVTFFGSGCLAGGGSLTNLPESEFAQVKLKIRLGRVDATAPTDGGIFNGKVASEVPQETIQLRDMVLRFTSNLSDTVWDTVLASATPALSGPQGDSQSVSVNVELNPLRWWNIEIKTHDINDSIIHYGNVGPISSKGGQTVVMSVPLIYSRFSLYEARYSFPKEVYAAGVRDSERVYQKIFFNRLQLSIDEHVIRDSTSFNPAITSAGARFITAGTALKNSDGHFFFKPSVEPSDTITHVQSYQYVKTGSRSFHIRAYGYLEGDSIGQESRLLFEGERSITITPGVETPVTPIVLDWVGPGSKKDPDAPPPTVGQPDWSGISMSVQIGKVGKVVQNIDIGGEIDL